MVVIVVAADVVAEVGCGAVRELQKRMWWWWEM